VISTVRRLELMRVQRQLRRAHWRAKLRLTLLRQRSPHPPRRPRPLGLH